MLFLLDTMVLAEPARPEPDPRVLAWLGMHAALDFAISTLTLGEIPQRRLPAPERPEATGPRALAGP